METARRQELSSGEEMVAFNLEHNQTLSDLGHKITSDFVKAFVRHSYPKLPEEGVWYVLAGSRAKSSSEITLW